MVLIYAIGTLVIAFEYGAGALIFLVEIIKALLKHDKTEPIGLDMAFFVIFSVACLVFSLMSQKIFAEGSNQ